jgi:outer membrane lipoprotein-sorting protein
MLSALMLAAALSGTRLSPLDDAIEHFRRVETYQVTLRSSRADGEDRIRYAYRKPGFVRMDFIRPHAGAVLVYSPLTGRVRLWPRGAGRFPELSLSPHNPLIRSPGGQTVDKSDVGALFDNVRALLAQGEAEVRGEADLEGRSALHLVVSGAAGAAVDGVHRYELWLDTSSRFPLKVISHDRQDAIIETVTMEALQINPPLAETLFDPEEE